MLSHCRRHGLAGDAFALAQAAQLLAREIRLAGTYLPLAIRPDGLRAALRALPALGFAGTNLTIPHKEAALDIVDRVDPLARRIGAVNCVIVAPDGTLEGQNHDAFGYIESVLEAQPDWRADAGPVVVIGAGGSARAVLVGLIDRGAREIRLINRTIARAQAMEQEFGGPIRALAWEERDAALGGAALLVNTTSQGMAGEPPLELNLDRLPKQRAGLRHHLHPARDAAARGRARARQSDRQRARHADPPGAPGLPRLVRHHAGCDARTARHARSGDLMRLGWRRRADDRRAEFTNPAIGPTIPAATGPFPPESLRGHAMNRRELMASAASPPFATAGLIAARGVRPIRIAPIRLVVPFSPGGATDVVGRLWAERMKPVLGTVVTENRGGGGGVTGAAEVARAQPDGHTFLFGNTSTQVLIPAIMTQSALRLRSRISLGIYILCNSPTSIVVHESVPARTLKELIAYAKANPGKLSYGSAGAGTLTNLAGELFKQLIGAPDIVHIPYKGAAPGVKDLASGHIPMMTPNVGGPLLELHRPARCASWRSTRRRGIKAAPDIPTAAEAGLPGMVAGNLNGLFAPAGVPQPDRRPDRAGDPQDHGGRGGAEDPDRLGLRADPRIQGRTRRVRSSPRRSRAGRRS